MGTVATKQAQAYIARKLANESASIYLGIGRSTAWADENKVPDSDPTATGIEEPIAYTKAQSVYLCKLVKDNKKGSLIFGGKSYNTVSPIASLDPDANYVYAATKFSYSDLQKEVQFRQVGLFIGFKPKANVHSTIILPSQVDDIGTMLSISNNKLVNITKTSAANVGAMYSILPIIN